MRDMVRTGEFVAQYKELVFDIDMTDYDDVRFCCSGADICTRFVHIYEPDIRGGAAILSTHPPLLLRT